MSCTRVATRDRIWHMDLPAWSSIVDDEEEDVREAKRQKSSHTFEEIPNISLVETQVDKFDEQYASQQTGGIGYLYLDAFTEALDTVLENEGELFIAEELSIFDTFRKLSVDAQKLYVRLFLRRRNQWFCSNKLGQYREVHDIEAAMRELASDSRFGTQISDSDDCLDIVLSMFTTEELKNLAKLSNYNKFKGNRDDMIRELKTRSDKQTCLTFTSTGLSLKYNACGKREFQGSKLMANALDILGFCLTLSTEAVKVFERAHLVFYRSSSYSDISLGKLILAKVSKRNFADYCVFRSTEVFRTRDELLRYESALHLQEEVDKMFDTNLTAQLDTAYTLLAPVYDLWLESQEMQNELADAGRDHYLIRFTASWVYTRLVYKFAFVLCRLARHVEAHKMYAALLRQKVYRRGKRGDWYQRKALIENTYFAKDPKERRLWKQTSLATCEMGLQDPDTHLIYHYDLQKRIVRLERDLRVLPKDKHCFDHVKLKQPTKRTFYGIRKSEPEIGKKTIWLLEDQTEGSVEDMCLSNYKKEGWKGYHTEGGIIKTMFAYLFWDIIFSPVLFVFETPFQNAPLDLGTDAFFLSRASLINARLTEIANGNAKKIIQTVYDREYVRKTECVGLDWRFDIEEIIEAVECMGGNSLSPICRMFCEDYQHRSSGMPDLFLWNYEKKECLFAEIKSENDRLSDTQRLWIDLLVGAGIGVELCAGLDAATVA
ncbi:uncharacterized protein V1518DRAFT_410687 [Limtongia smithiae]|uniref:uncharacterized protein n=1 Tax=Limtongia smithiae TaxID=1125753 RepID=UPI0034CF706A